MKNKLIIYELNEMPRKLLNYYVKLKPYSNLSKLKMNGYDLNTFTTDLGELHPWSTWATFYRGVDNSKHKIYSLNQDREFEREFPPIWKLLIENNITIGIFGTLQSYPPIINENVKFYLPDTFAPNYDAYPKELKNFQRFNLKIVANNSGEVRSIRFLEIKYFLKCILINNIRIKSILKIFIQLFKETINKRYKKRRSLIQPELTFDLYYKNLKKYKPEFTTFFTNHLAGMMHYFWLDIFPKDFKKAYRSPNLFNKKSVIKALDIADKQIGLLMKFAEDNSYQLWVASSMGQKAIEREKNQKIFLRDFNKLLRMLNLDSAKYNHLPSMYPDINIEGDTLKNLKLLINEFLEIKFSNKKSIFHIRYKKNPKKINFIITSTSKKEKYLFYRDQKIKIENLGLEFGLDDQGTGYHYHKGVLLAKGTKNKAIFGKEKIIDTKKFYKKIIKVFEIRK
tara:strand:+ start:489 stop:1844 length:1356 start_codon:yes stop_codon:yes gene_type:complete